MLGLAYKLPLSSLRITDLVDIEASPQVSDLSRIE